MACILTGSSLLAKEKSKQETRFEELAQVIDECVHWNGEGRYNENAPEFEEGKTPCDFAVSKLKLATEEFPTNSDLLVSISNLAELNALTGEESFFLEYCNGLKKTMKSDFQKTGTEENLYSKYCPEQAKQIYGLGDK